MSKYNIVGKRYLRKYTEENTSPVYAANIQAQRIVDTFCDVPWQAVRAKSAGMTYHTDEIIDEESSTTGLEKNVEIRDGFDAALFCAGHLGGQHRAYANAACYVYTIPDGAVGSVVTSLGVKVTSDPYNSRGARIHVMTSATLDIPMNCHTVRGEDSSGVVIEDGTTAAAVAPRTVSAVSGKNYWYPTTSTATLSPTNGLTLQKYLFIFVCLESYSTVRGNWLEGCSFIENLVEMTTSADVTGWTDGETYDLAVDPPADHSFDVCRDGVLPALASTYTGVKHITVQRTGDSLTPTTIGANQIATVTGLKPTWLDVEGEIYSVCVPPLTIDNALTTDDPHLASACIGLQLGTVVGTFKDGSIPGIPGLYIYDMNALGGPAKMTFEMPLGPMNHDILSRVLQGKLRKCYPYPIRTDISRTTVDIPTGRYNGGEEIIYHFVTKLTQTYTVLLYFIFDDGIAIWPHNFHPSAGNGGKYLPSCSFDVLYEQSTTEDQVPADYGQTSQPALKGYPVATVKAPIDSYSLRYGIDANYSVRLWFDTNAICEFVTATSYHQGGNPYASVLALGVQDGMLMSTPFLSPIGNEAISVSTGIFPTGGVEVVGTINEVCPAPGSCYDINGNSVTFESTHSVMVSGDLTSVGGVSCSGLAIITAGATADDPATIVIPDFGANLNPVPGTGFRATTVVPLTSGLPGDSCAKNMHMGTVLLCGRFTGFGGDSSMSRIVCVKPAGNAVDPVAAIGYDFMDVDSKGIVYAAMTGNNRGLVISNPEKVYENIHTSVTEAQSCIGLRTLYAKFYNGEVVDADTDATGSNERVGAGFSVKTATASVVSLSDASCANVTVPLWQMTMSSLVVPFSVPQDFRVNRIRLAWSALAATGGKLNVWLRRGEYITEVPDIDNPAIYTGEKSSVSSWTLLGQIDATETSATFDIDPLEDYVGTLMFTAYISLDDLNPSAGMTMPQGVCTGMSVDPLSGAVTGVSANWKPNITLEA